MAVSDFIEVRIYGQRFKLRAGDEASYVRELADYVDRAMLSASNQSKAVSVDRIAIMAALNIADTLFQHRRRAEIEAEAVDERINRLIAYSDQLLED